MITIQEKAVIIKIRIKLLEGRKYCKLKDDLDILESLEDIENKIQALTNMLEML